ncbi:hypothetical protein GCM10007880_57500 [Mesorhizobium amorphae]|uniref:hypothetical protein n=1 Tax=Mesorhizobium amorphae TaxID=71433 RepID=UPI00235D8AC9|nr:hypothetical protein [Mesorhizobium amorphae]GLR45233.1 hypothetical protein GCM10007880_57500 [Mesorhizobium amorphae]
MSDRVKHRQSKASALAKDGTLNPAPEKIRDQKFREDGFFDPRDIVQVKYEMLRRIFLNKMSVTEVSNEYPVSRPTPRLIVRDQLKVDPSWREPGYWHEMNSEEGG